MATTSSSPTTSAAFYMVLPRPDFQVVIDTLVRLPDNDRFSYTRAVTQDISIRALLDCAYHVHCARNRIYDLAQLFPEDDLQPAVDCAAAAYEELVDVLYSNVAAHDPTICGLLYRTVPGRVPDILVLTPLQMIRNSAPANEPPPSYPRRRDTPAPRRMRLSPTSSDGSLTSQMALAEQVRGQTARRGRPFTPTSRNTRSLEERLTTPEPIDPNLGPAIPVNDYEDEDMGGYQADTERER